jgi:hypothetical protein
MNFLEELVAEWYEFKGYFVHRNILVGPRIAGGYECELDVVAFNAAANHLVHIEASMDTDSWENRERRFTKKFAAGKKYIPQLFAGFALPPDIEQIALFVFAASSQHSTVGGGRLQPIKDFMNEIRLGVQKRRVDKAAVPEQYQLLRALQFAANFWLAD